MSGWWPVAASAYARAVDHLFLALLLLSTAVLALVFGLLLRFTWRYRRGNTQPRDTESARNWWMEIGWTVATFPVFLALFVWGAHLFLQLFQPPAGATQIFVVGKQWMWKIQHPDGQREINALHVPLGQKIELVMTSQDVIHSFWLPALRVRHDVLPGVYTRLWFQADREGVFPLLCTEFCGADHASMGGYVEVMQPDVYERWLADNTMTGTSTLARQGEAIYRAYGCGGCHDARQARGPLLAGVYGTTVQLADGRSVRADDDYMRRSILRPRADLVAGYAPTMPSYAGQIGEDDMLLLLAYLREARAK